MEFLRKTIVDENDRRKDNSDKKLLFEKDRHPTSANSQKDNWFFIKDSRARENIAYQMQYLEFLIYLYNDYQIYLTIESLLCKNIMIVIAGVVESALHDLVNQLCKDVNLEFSETTNPVKLIQEAFDLGIIDKEMKDNFHNLRKVRNLVHLKGIEYQEHDAYALKEVNNYLEILEKFRKKVGNT